MTVEDQEVTHVANGHYSTLFPRPEVDDAPQVADQPEPSVNFTEGSAVEDTPERRGAVAFVKDVAAHQHTRSARPRAPHVAVAHYREA